MSDPDRGPYGGAEPPLAFDPRRPVRGAGPVPLTLIISALVLVVLVAGVAFLYRGGARHGDQGPAPVGEPLTDIKSPAPPQASDNDVATGLTIYKTGDGNAVATNAVTLVPPPEQPQPMPAAAAPPPPPPPATVAVAPPPPPPAPAAAPPPKLAVAAPKPSPGAKPADKGTMTLAGLEDQADRDHPAPRPPPSKSPPPKPGAKPADAAAAAPPPGAHWVQIGALSSQALAEKAWNDVAKLAPAAMAGKGRKVEVVTKDGKSLYRTYVTGFASDAQAEALCGKLKAGGHPCMVK